MNSKIFIFLLFIINLNFCSSPVFHKALITNNIEILNKGLGYEKYVNQYYNGESSLDIAFIHSPAWVIPLISKGAKIQQHHLYPALKLNSLELVNLFIAKGVKFQSEHFNYAIQKNLNIEIIKKIFKQDFDCDVIIKENKTLLCYAIKNNNIETVKFLINNGADVNYQIIEKTINTPYPITVLNYSVEHCNSFDIPKLLIKKGANKNWLPQMLDLFYLKENTEKIKMLNSLGVKGPTVFAIAEKKRKDKENEDENKKREQENEIEVTNKIRQEDYFRSQLFTTACRRWKYSNLNCNNVECEALRISRSTESPISIIYFIELKVTACFLRNHIHTISIFYNKQTGEIE